MGRQGEEATRDDTKTKVPRKGEFDDGGDGVRVRARVRR
jgi:hypothetical protein